jgi:GT2 family glycosyltransferase
VIPTKDRPADLCRVLSALLHQTLLPEEIIIIDQSCSDECASAVAALYGSRSAALPRLVYVHDSSIDGLTAARNEGLRRSAASVVVYLDDDGIPHQDALLLLLQALRTHPDLLAVGGVITTYAPPSRLSLLAQKVFYRGPFWDERQPVYWNWSRYAPGEIIPTTKLNGGLSAFRREALVAIGGFDGRYRGASVGEDVEVSQRLLRHAGYPTALALVGGAWLAHESRGQWKSGQRSLEFQMVAAHYLLSRSLPRTALNTLRFYWAVLGMLAIASVASVRRRTLGPIRSILDGLRSIWTGYANCPFLKPESPEGKAVDAR